MAHFAGVEYALFLSRNETIAAPRAAFAAGLAETFLPGATSPPTTVHAPSRGGADSDPTEP